MIIKRLSSGNRMVGKKVRQNSIEEAEIYDSSYYLAHSKEEDYPIPLGSDNLTVETSEESTLPMLSKRDEMSLNNTSNNNNWQRSYTLFLYSITTVLLFADQNLLAPNLSAIAEEFGYDNDERDKKLGGDIALAFFLLGAPASFVVGCGADADSVPRNFLFGLTVLIGEGSCFCTYFTTTYAGLYVTRALTGFSVGGALPLLSSVLGDWFPPQQRSAVMASVGIGCGVGIAIGQGIAGFMGPSYGWRSPFLVVSIPALVVAILLMTTVKDPVRGGSEIANIMAERREEEARRDNTVNHQDENDMPHNPPSPLEVVSFESEHATNNYENNVDDILPESETNNNDRTNSRCERCLVYFKPSTYASHIKTTKELLQSKTVLLAILQGAPGCIRKYHRFAF